VAENVIAPNKTTNEIVQGGVLIARRLARFDIEKSIERIRGRKRFILKEQSQIDAQNIMFTA
jgi:hypothetical protein